MAEDDPHNRSRREPEPEAAPAEFLFQDDPRLKSKHAPDPGDAPGLGAGEVFDLADAPNTDEMPPLSPIGPVRGGPSKERASQSEQGKTARASDQTSLDPSDLVEEVWSRTAEWGPTLIVVGGWVAFVLLLVCFVLDIWPAILALIVGGMVAAVLAYPILITLERPVRITPEQAVGDYYGALSHHLPHFRRMWLLLSRAGRISTAYGSFEGFKAYWKDRLGQLRGDHAGPLTPLVFEVADFRADKSAGRIRIDAEFTLRVWARGQRHAGTIRVVPMKIALVRGPDRMWYLEDGTLGRDEGRAAEPTTAPRP